MRYSLIITSRDEVTSEIMKLMSSKKSIFQSQEMKWLITTQIKA